MRYVEIAAMANASGDYGFWDMPAKLPLNLIMATLAAEDRRFHQHPGLDSVALVGAVRDNVWPGRARRGAPTLAMQTARLQRSGGAGKIAGNSASRRKITA